MSPKTRSRRAAPKAVELDDDDRRELEAAGVATEEADEDDADDEGDEEDEGTDELDAEGPESKIRRKIESEKARDVLMQIHREIPGRGEVALPSLKVQAERFDEFRDIICQKYGGTDPDGSYRVVFKLGGKYAGTLSFQAEGPPITVRYQEPEEETEILPEPSEPERQSVEPALTAAGVAQIIADTLEKQRAADELTRLRAENAELKSRPAAPVHEDKTLTELTAGWKELMTATTRTVNAESPESKMMKDRLDAAEAATKALEQKLRDKEGEANAARFARLESLLRRKKKIKKSPMSGIVATLAEITATDAMLAKISKRADEGESAGLLEGVIEIFKPEVQKLAMSSIKSFRKKMEQSQRDQAAGAEAGTGEIDSAAWSRWVNAILKNPALVEDGSHVRMGLRKFKPYVSRLIATKDKAGLVAFVRETLHEDAAKQFESATDEQVANVLGMLEVLRGTVVNLATAEPEPEAQESDEDDDEDDDADTVDGKVVN